MQANKMGATTRQLKLLLLVIKKKYIDFCFIYFFPSFQTFRCLVEFPIVSLFDFAFFRYLLLYCISLDALTAVIPCDIERVDF